MSAATIALLATGFTLYNPQSGPSPRIEAVTDKGTILELIVRCPQGSAILSYSKIERIYCDPKLRCGPDLKTLIRRTCR